MNAMQMLEHYKDNGERVDEVLFNQISKELDHLRTIIDKKNYSIDLIGDQKVQAQRENKRLRKALEFYADRKTYHAAIDVNFGGGRVFVIDEDEGQIARDALEGE